jgi:hypothetical protein
MAAIEYGSDYWCIILNGKDANTPGKSIHLHADSVAVDPTGTPLQEGRKARSRYRAGARVQQGQKKTTRKRTKKMKRTTRMRKREHPKMATAKAE